ncbi:MAG: hypothetical protein ABIV05_04550 [Actinomycetota bacterium]
MGFEVMDAHGATPTSSSTDPLVPFDLADDGRHVVDLGESHEPAGEGPPSWRGSFDRLRSHGGDLVLPVAVALVVGALLGGFVAGQRSGAARLDARASQLAVVAQVESSSVAELSGTVRAELTARVTNAGPEPVAVATEPLGTDPNPLTPVVVTGPDRLGPGASSVVRVQVLLACGSATMPEVALQVRTADGRGHPVALQSTAAAAGTLTSLCADARGTGPVVRARLGGTTSRPVVTVANDGDVVVGVSFASVVSKGTPDVEGLVTILTSPAMPLIIGAHGERSVAVSVRARRCVRDVATLGGLSDISYPALIVTDSNGRVLQGGGSGPSASSVDLSLLVSQAVARACG